MGRWGKEGQRWPLWTGAAGFLLVVGYAAVGALQVLVWNPLAAVPGATLAEIQAAMDRANESLAAPAVLIWAATGIILAAAILIAALKPAITGRTAAALDLLLLALAAPSHWMASFPAGMGLADTFDISGGDYAPWGKILYAVSALSLVAVIMLVVRRKRRSAA
ncbi:hypothetical protein ACFRAU_25015 [Arthrobacter sp. NPDC056691]|uniref:hypothetical protein n=1 Tax=Arthrobacter sp. NPDC056691 TaxID=3345913 RepID=UPI003671670D